LIDWPEDSPYRNRMSVEVFLKSRIVASQVTLLGELDLDENTDYHGIEVTLAQLANHVFEQDGFQKNLLASNEDRWGFPATIAIWAVSKQQQLKDGTELWSAAGLDQNRTAGLAVLFSKSIEMLGLETFSGKLRNTQHNLMLARLHSLIPNYAMSKYATMIKRSSSYNTPKEKILQEITTSQDISKAVSRLFDAKVDLGLDLIERSVKTIQTGKPAGLPLRITNALLNGVATVKYQKKTNIASYPVIRLDRDAAVLYISDNRKWELTDEMSQRVSLDPLPQSSLWIDRERNIQLLDLEHGYLLFNEDLRISDSKTLSRSGWILWKKGVNFNKNQLTRDPMIFGNWKEWEFASYSNLDDLSISTLSGAEHLLKSRKPLQITTIPIPHVFFLDEFPVFSEMPIIPSGHTLSVIDNLTGESMKIEGEGATLSNKPYGIIDVSIYAGLGRAINIQGLVVPGLSITGLGKSLFPQEKRIAKFFAPEGWQADNEIEINSKFATGISLRSPDSIDWQLKVDLRPVTWSFRIRGLEPSHHDNTVVFPYSKIKDFSAVVLHNVVGEAPRIMLKDDSRGATVLVGNARESDVLYDLKPVRDILSKKFQLLLNDAGREFIIADFNDVHENREEKTKDLRDLAKLASKRWENFAEQWDEYVLNQRKESQELLKRLRNRRTQ
jgi:hypothetical protein